MLRWAVAAVVVLHGLIHLLGAAKGLGWAPVAALREPIGSALGAGWLTAAVLLVLAGVLLAMGASWWWAVGAVAVVASQGVVCFSWTDAALGTLPNAVLLVAVIQGFAAEGPNSLRAEYRRRVRTAFSVPLVTGLVTEADLADLPDGVAGYVRTCGGVGQPRVQNVRARIHGRIRAGADSSWMSFTGEQVNTFGPEPSRLFLMGATSFGFPVDVLHTYVAATATMRVKLVSLVPVVNAAGPEMDRGETVTLFNDLCLLAPAALVDAPITWQPVDSHHVRGTYSVGRQAVTAELTFNRDHELVDFVSDDRLRASRDGKTFLRQPWSTPVGEYRTVDARRHGTYGEARWHAPGPEGDFTYIELHVDDVTYNTSTAVDQTATERPAPTEAR